MIDVHRHGGALLEFLFWKLIKVFSLTIDFNSLNDVRNKSHRLDSTNFGGVILFQTSSVLKGKFSTAFFFKQNHLWYP